MRTERTIDTLAVHAEPSGGPPPHAGTEGRFRDLLGDAAGALLGGVEGLTSVLPGGAIVSAALRGGVAAAASAERTAAALASDPLSAALGRQAETQMQYLQLQQQMQDENQRFTTLSNVLKARHETAKTAIGNLR
jgi:hypothetical protein